MAARHSYAHFATKQDIYETGLASRPDSWLQRLLRSQEYQEPTPSGVILGTFHDQGRTRYLCDQSLDNVLVLGDARCGKRVSISIPTLLAWRHSAFVLDQHGHLYAATHQRLEACGHRTLYLNPWSPITARWNPLRDIRRDTVHEAGDIRALATALVHTPRPDRIARLARLMLEVAIGHVLHRLPESEHNLLRVRDVLRQMQTDEQCILPPASSAGTPGLLPFETVWLDCLANWPTNDKFGCHQTLAWQLKWIDTPELAAATAASTLSVTDLRHADRPVTLFIAPEPWHLQAYMPLLRVLASMANHRLTDVEWNGLDRQVLLLLPDYNELPEAIEPLHCQLAYGRKYGVKTVLMYHSAVSLQGHAGLSAGTVRANCRVHVFFAPHDQTTATWMSEECGERTTMVTGVRMPVLSRKDAMHLLRGPTRDERDRIKAPGDVLVTMPDHRPIIARQAYYWLNPAWRHSGNRDYTRCVEADVAPQEDADATTA